MNMIKAGRRLDNLISEDTGYYMTHKKQINRIFEKDEQKRQKMKKTASIPQLNENIQKPAIISNRPQTQSKQETITKSYNNLNLVPKEISIKKPLGVSGAQLNKYKDLVKDSKNLPPYITNYLKSPVFEKTLEVEKFKNLKSFYSEKFKLMSKYLSEEDLNKFISRTDEKMIINNQNSQILHPKSQEDIENLEILRFLEKEEEKNETRIKKILKINTEIQTRLLKEDHIYKLQQLQELRLQQNRQLFKLIDELPSNFPNYDDRFLFTHKRPETSDDGLCKRNFLRYKPQKTQETSTKPFKIENLTSYNPNIDPKNKFFNNVFNKNTGFNQTNLNITNIQNSYIDKDKETSNLARACTSDAKYRSLKAADCKNSFNSNMFFFKNEQEEIIFTNKNKEDYKNLKSPQENLQTLQTTNKNTDKILKPSKKKKKKKIIEETKITLEKWKSLPDSLRNLILFKNQENFNEIKEVDMPKYLTKFNQTKYHLKKQKDLALDIKKEEKVIKEASFLDEKEFELNGIGLNEFDLGKDYGVYKDQDINSVFMDNNEKINIFNYIDSREWSNNF